MKTLSEHERDRPAPSYETAWVGVACDRCGAELYNPSPGIMLTTDPPKINVRCSKCDFSGYMTR
jgi:ribosomal protein S27E